MKQPKRLSRIQKRHVTSAGLNPDDYMYVFEDLKYLHIRNKETNGVVIIDLKKGRVVPHANQIKEIAYPKLQRM